MIIALVVVFAVNSAMNSFGVDYDNRLNSKGRDVVERIDLMVNGESDSDKATNRIASGMMTVGDYAIHSFVSPAYLAENKSDADFARDLCYVLYGEYDDDVINDITADLESYSRQYVIDTYVSELDSDYAASSSIDKTGSTFTNCVVTKPIGGEGGFTIGIREVEGYFGVSGDEVRTDFFVDGVLYQGNLKMTETENGQYNFVMAWDTAGVDEGKHEVQVLLRSSDGRGMATAGGDIYVPHCDTLENFAVSRGSITSGSDDSWYVLDAGENHAFINFVELSDDIAVTLYDVYGNVIGTNDIENSPYEVLRGYKQDVKAVEEETGIIGISNVFYIRVTRGSNCTTNDSINYTMVQSLNVAYFEGLYMAVLDDVGIVPTPLPVAGYSSYSGTEVRLKNEFGDIISVDYDSVKFLPLNGFLTRFSITDAVTGKGVPIFPAFDQGTENYGFYTDSLERFTINAVSQEGYAGSVKISSESAAGTFDAYQGQVIDAVDGENKVTVTVTSFTGQTKVYTIYLLKGDDNGTFTEDTLSEFPESYGSGLWLLHNIHPDYIFRAYNTGLDYYDVLANEDKGSRSLASMYTHPNWVKSDSPVYDGGGWKAATNDVVNYFLDPRNFLDPQHVFMFELLSFDPNVQTVDGVRAMIAGTFMDTDDYDYAATIYTAGEIAGVSPYLLASRILQEMGYSGQSLLCKGALPGYEGIYNFYNIGSTPNPDVENGALINGALYALYGHNRAPGELNEKEIKMRIPWDNIDDAIIGGAIWIASGYTEVGQDTLYFQKFDVIDNDDGLFEHQYAQNISMAFTEGARYFNSYASIGMVNQQFVFLIPVYENMPEYFGYIPDPGA